MSMKEYTLTEISITAVAIMGAFGSCFAVIFGAIKKSRCSNINICGIIKCKRKVILNDNDNNLANINP